MSSPSTPANKGFATTLESPLNEMSTLAPTYDISFLQDDTGAEPGRLKPEAQLAVDWLKDNFVRAETMNVPRDQVHTEYLAYCDTVEDNTAMNLLRFARLMKNIYPNVSSRRLGARNASKFYYHGLDVKKGSYLAIKKDMSTQMKPLTPLVKPSKSGKSQGSKSRAAMDSVVSMTSMPIPKLEQSLPVEKQKLTNLFVPDFPPINVNAMDPGVSIQLFRSFVSLYKMHFSDLVFALNQSSTNHVSELVASFWHSLPTEYVQMLSGAYTSKYICDCDTYLFSMVLNYCYAESLQPWANATVEQYASLSKNFEQWTARAVSNVPDSTRVLKIQVAIAFAHSLKRALHLQQVSSKLRPVLTSETILSRLIHDWKNLDFVAVNEYVCWAAQWQDGFIEAVENDILSMLHKKATLVNWTTWLNSLIQRSINFPMLHENYDLFAVEYAAKQFVTKFGLFTTQLVRDLTLRSVLSFSSWQLLYLFIDEYIWHMTTKNLTLLKISHFGKIGIMKYPDWINGTLFFHLEAAQYFGAAYAQDIARGVSRAPSMPSLPRLPSNADLLANIPMLSRGASYEHMHQQSMSMRSSIDFGSYHQDGNDMMKYDNHVQPSKHFESFEDEEAAHAAGLHGGKTYECAPESTSLAQILNYHHTAFNDHAPS